MEGKKISADSKDSNKKDVDQELGFPIIGTDESGKGDYFGPLVSAGVYVDEQTAKKLVACGVKDSKNLSDKGNLRLAQEITKLCKGRFVIIEISPERYNLLYEQFKKEKKNLNTLLAWGHAKAIEEILHKVDCEVAIADQFADERFILGKLQEKGKRLRLIQMHKAEQNIAVAAASILARSRFLEKLSKLSKKYKIDLPKGASQTVVKNAKKFVDIHGKESLRKVAKLHFKTTNEVFRE
ncbi:MAG: ribonuclease HIII [Candidatus Methanogaster sp.]|uniref:Ribonuclease HIII n=1 Tax=Candidatus Methanogaster sp. TaxID=3386292 RepID=A0AC61L5K6_9EURY|nr:MAG: ribonuclease HIII [ANME-2 cluster archaeon]